MAVESTTSATTAKSSLDNKIISGLGIKTFDSKALLEALIAAKKAPADVINAKIDKNTKKLSAFSEQKVLLTTLKNALDGLRNPPGFGQTGIFSKRTAYVTSNTSVPGNNYVGATIDDNASIGNYKITVEELATGESRRSQSFATRDAAIVDAAGTNNAGKFSAGTFQINGKSVTLNQGGTLNDVAAAINAANANVQASIVKIADNDYRLNIVSTKTGVGDGAIITTDTPDDVFSSTVTFTTTGASNSKITIDGEEVERSTNNISDVVDGVTFNLFQKTPLATELKFGVEADTGGIAEKIVAFVDAYNQYKVFAQKQSERDETGSLKDTALLYGSPALGTSLTKLGTELSRVIPGIASGAKQLADIGIVYDDFLGDDESPATPNVLRVDAAKLSAALANNFDQVRKVFEFDFTASSAGLKVVSRTNDLTAISFEVDIDLARVPANEAAKVTKINGVTLGTPIFLTVTNNIGTSATLEGPAGTALAGMKLFYSGDGTDVITANQTQGIGDRIYNFLSGFLDEVSGILKPEEQAITDANTRFKTEVTRILEIVDRFREQQLRKFAAVEAALAKFESIKNYLTAQSDAIYAASRS